jgi:retron-type reverse transcriptase
VPHLFARAIDTRNLRVAWDYLAASGGQAPGPDGWSYADLDHHETWALLRQLHRALEGGSYGPGPERRIQIPKTSGRGHRTLRLQNIVDRVVQRAVLQVLEPVLDPRFVDNSFGFRPRRGREQALARVEHLARHHQRWHWVTEDLQDAFDNVPLRRLEDILQQHLPEPRLRGLLARMLHTGRKRGLRQGGALSPLLLNVYLDHFLDRRWQQQQPDVPLLRVATICCCSAQPRKQRQVATTGCNAWYARRVWL